MHCINAAGADLVDDGSDAASRTPITITIQFFNGCPHRHLAAQPLRQAIADGRPCVRVVSLDPDARDVLGV